MTKILFVCGSLEPGRDGVGDYSRELAGAIKQLGLSVQIIAIRDRDVEGIQSELQDSREGRIEVTRLSKNLNAAIRKKEYRNLVRAYKPDWISLQYVPYAFSAKGIPVSLPNFLDTGDPTVKWHFMIHEGYLGGDLGIKDQLIKKIQIGVIKSLRHTLNPAIIHTSTPQYRQYLKEIDVDSQLLGLFGNIPIVLNDDSKLSGGVFRGVYFGASPSLERINELVMPLRRYLESEKNSLEIILCGKSGDKGRHFANMLRQGVNSDRFKVLEMGGMDIADLSKLFQSVDFGIARIPPNLLGKSGSAIALLEHGLPLWIPLAKSKEDINKQFDFRTNQCFVNLKEIRDYPHRFIPGSRLQEIAKLFKEQLTQ